MPEDRGPKTEDRGPQTIAGNGAAIAALPDPRLLHLLVPKVLTMRARSASDKKGREVRVALLAVVGFLFWAFIFGLLYKLLAYFRGIPEIGPLLAGKLLGLMLVSFFAILLLSNIITALSSFFLAKDLDLLVSGPVDWLRLYGAKLIETVIASSWMVALMAIPVFTAYGWVYRGGWGFGLFAVAVFVPFLVIPAVIGSAITLMLVNIFPARRTRDILSVVAVVAAAGIVLLFRLVRPEQLANPDKFKSLVDFVAVLRTPTSPLLPSEWVQRSVMGLLNDKPDWLAVYMLWTTALAFVVLGALLHRTFYVTGFSKAQESGQRWARSGRLSRFMMRVLRPLGVLKRELLMKEMRVFFRDTTQWSQLILLAVLVVVYVFNIKFLPLKGEGITLWLINVVPFLNLVLAGFVLASIAARFIFPAVSLEGRTLWLLRSSPISMGDLLWAKFWVGTAPLLILALLIVGVTDYLLKVTPFMFVVSTLTIAMMTFAISGLAIGFGTVFPQFETENAAQIPTSFGGLLFMMASVVVIGAVVVLEARPVFSFLSSRLDGHETDLFDMVFGFGAAFMLCAVATVVPIRVALTRLEAVER
jgi:ABC-2 type transport system permease protein